jgi:nucleotide-binding universal stress UspA family protein
LDQQWENQRLIVLKYLDNLQHKLARHNVTIYKAVELGSAGETIIDYAHTHPVDLIVMATHGRSGLSRWVYGSVADKVLRGAEVPVLLVRVREKELAA